MVKHNAVVTKYESIDNSALRCEMQAKANVHNRLGSGEGRCQRHAAGNGSTYWEVVKMGSEHVARSVSASRNRYNFADGNAVPRCARANRCDGDEKVL